MRLRLSILLTHYKRQRAKHFRVWLGRFVRVRRIELPTTAWKAVVLPLNYTRFLYFDCGSIQPRLSLQSYYSLRSPEILPPFIQKFQNLLLYYPYAVHYRYFGGRSHGLPLFY